MCKVFVRSENFTNDCYFLRYEYVFNSERLFTKAKGIGSMDDREIIELYWERSDNAIAQMAEKYGRYIHKIAYAILGNPEDSEECVNDTYIKAWNAMPPHKPQLLSVFLGKITRNTALDRYEYTKAKKRTGQVVSILDEMELCIPDQKTGGSLADELALKEAINGFLRSLPTQTRKIFVRRYWYMSPVKEIARDFGLTVSNVKVTLLRTRNRFKEYLEQEGIEI